MRASSSPRPGERLLRELRSGRHPAAAATFFALAIHLLAYRIALGWELAQESSLRTSGMLGWSERLPVVRTVGAGLRDLPLLFGLAGLVALASWAGREASRTVRIAGGAALLALLLAVGIASAANLRMVVVLGAGLNLPAIFEAGTIFTGGDVDDFVGLWDLLLAVSPPVLYLVLLRVCSRLPRAVWTATRRTMILGLGVLATAPGPSRDQFAVFVRDHPLQVIAQQFVSAQFRSAEALEPLARASRGREGFIDPALVEGTRADAMPGAQAEPGASVLLIVLESVALPQLSSVAADGSEPMPFLRRLLETGWQLGEHRTASNSSDGAAFGMFTGLYDPPNTPMAVTSARLRAPAIWSRIGVREAFLITSARLDGYFPLGLARNDGLKEIEDYFTLDSNHLRPHPESSRNERDAVEALVERIGRTRGRRFFGTYWADAAHLPYFDHDPTRRWIADPTDDRERYLNCLRVVDEALRRTVEALRAAGHGDDTLLVVVSDHGEAFGEHGSFAHRSAWEEVLRVPALLWQPRWFSPRNDQRVTSHVDLLPTLLDALGVSFDPLDFQGESLLADRLRRRYVFASGREGTAVSWSRERRKLVWRWVEGTCTTFDLVGDPTESRPAPCLAEDPQWTATKRFVVSQRGLLGRVAARDRLRAEP